MLVHEHPAPLKSLKGAACEWSVESYFLKEAGELKSLIAQEQLPLRSLVQSIWGKSDGLSVRMANSPDRSFNLTDVAPLPHLISCVSGIGQDAFNSNARPFADETVTLVVHSGPESDGILNASVLVSRNEVV